MYIIGYIFPLLSLFPSIIKAELATENACENWNATPTKNCECVPHSCNSACCNSQTCKLFDNATCATGSCCDLSTCQIKPIATVCRVPQSACDLPEFCNGLSQYCPNDVFKQNFETCQYNLQYCYEAECKSFSNITLENIFFCPNNCSGNGVCNNLGHCHCDIGFSGTICLQSGPGGSTDSGPATNPHFLIGFPRFSYIAFCAAIPLVVLLNFLVCLCCKKFECTGMFREPKKYRPSNARKQSKSQLETTSTNII